MKKFTKLVGILLTLAMVLSMVPATVVGAVSAGTTGTGEIVQGRVLNIYPATNITTVFGYYSDGTGADESTFVDGNDGECVTDGWFGRAGYSECTPADGLVALVMTLSEPIDLGGMEMISHGDDYSPTSFDVQAYVDGAWVTVYTQSSNAFTSNLTQMFDFGTSTTTSKVRVLIYGTKANGECRFKEVTLYEASTGNQYEFIDLTGRGSSADQNAANPVGNLVNQDKSDIFLASIATFDLTNNGQPTTVDGFNLGAYRVDSNPFPSTVTVEIKKTAGGEYESIGTYSTGWSTGSVADTLVVNFDQSYDAYGIRFSFDKWSYMNVLELFQFTRETTQAPTEPAPTEPAPGDYIKIDLTNSNLIGGCSGSYAARDVSTSTNFDAISWFFNKSSKFERIEGLVDGNTTSTYGEWGMDPNEGADFYLKLDSATAIDQIRLYSYTYDSRYAMPQNFKVFLVLQDGSAVEKSFTTGWSSSTANGTPCTFDLGQTYTVTGVYVLSTTNTPAYQDAGKFSLAEVELYQKQVPVDPNAPVIEKVTGLAPEFGYYTDGTTGAITPYYQSGREPGFLIDGDSSTQTRSDYYLHEDITTNAKTPVILFELGETKVLTSIKIEGYQYERYNMEDFEIQVSNSTGADNWVTVATVEDAFRDGANGDDVAPMSIDLGGVSANKIRILISGITDMSAEMEDETDTELLLGGYIRVKEITLFQNTNATPEEPTEPDVQLSAPTGLTATVTDSTITATADTVEGGTLMFRINGGEWQASGEFTGLNRNTTYTIEAMYVGAEGYIDSAVATIEATTAKTALTAPTGLAATTTDSTITATADAIEGGTLMFRVNGGEWQTSGEFTGLNRNTTYTVEAMYVAADGYIDSAVATIEATTAKTQLTAPTGLTATVTDSTITATADTVEGGTLMFRINGGEWQASGEFTGLDRNTTYTIEAMYVAADGYIDSAVATIEATTAKIALTAPTGLAATTTDTTITATADTNANGTLMFRVNGGEWQTSGEFTGLNRNTTYTVEAMYVGAEGYNDSDVTTIEVTTTKTALTAPTGLAATTTDSTITATADAIEGGTLMFRVNGGEWQTSGEFTGLDRNTTYTIEAMYVAADGYIDSGVATIEATTAKTQLETPVITVDDYTPDSFTVVVPDVIGGTAQYKIDDGEWQDSGVFTHLKPYTEYTIYVKYVGDEGFVDSEVASQVVTTEKAGLETPFIWNVSETDTTLTFTVSDVTGGTTYYRLLTSKDGDVVADWQTSNTFTGLTRNTTYFVEVIYVGEEGYSDSATATLYVSTDREKLPAPTITQETVTADTIVVSVPAVENGTAKYRINGGEWQTTGEFTGLLPGAAYTVEAIYEATHEDYAESEVVTETITTDTIPLDAPTITVDAVTDDSITVSVPAVTGGTAMYRIDGGEWQASGEFTGLDRNTTYTVEAMYVAEAGYIDSAVATIEATTAKTQLTAPTGLAATTTDSTITATADAIEGGTLMFRVNGGEWQTSGEFTGLNRNTTYTVEAMYVAADGYIDSDVATIEATTAKTQLTAPTGLAATTTDSTITATADAIEGGTLMFRVNGGEWQTSGEFTGLTDNTSYTVEAMYVAADGYIDSGIATITVTTDEKDLGLNIVETNSLAGISFSVRLIEPWAVRADIKFYEGQQPNHTLLNLADMKSYGVYAIAGSKFENANGATLEDLLRDSDTIHFEMSETAEDGKIYPINATQARFEFYDCLYTYHMSEAVYMVTYYEDAEGGLHFSRVRSKTLTEVIDGLKNIDEKEAKVYNSMKQMEATVMAYRATLSSSSLNAVYPAGQSITNSGITFGAGSESGAYKFGTQVSIKLIEPWGVKVSMRIVETSDTSVNIDYDAADDYGVIFFHDKAGEYADGMTVAQITAKDDAQVYSKSLGNVSIEDGRICAIYDQGIFTYEMDSTLYCMPYVVINGEYHYREIVVDDESYIDCAFDLNLIEKIGVFSEDINLSAEERAVYDAMMQMNADVVEYRAQFN